MFINLESALGLRKNCTFAQLDLGQRFDWPGNARRIGMTGEVCTELRVAPKQQHGEAGGERRERTPAPGVQRAKSASSHYDLTHERPDPSPVP